MIVHWRFSLRSTISVPRTYCACRTLYWVNNQSWPILGDSEFLHIVLLWLICRTCVFWTTLFLPTTISCEQIDQLTVEESPCQFSCTVPPCPGWCPCWAPSQTCTTGLTNIRSTGPADLQASSAGSLPGGTRKTWGVRTDQRNYKKRAQMGFSNLIIPSTQTFLIWASNQGFFKKMDIAF